MNERVAAEVGVTAATVGKWRKRFIEAGLDGLADGERSGRPKADLLLSEEERGQLMRRGGHGEPKTSQALALRSKIVLACADGGSNKKVAADLRVSAHRWGIASHARSGGVIHPRPPALEL